MAIYVRCRLWMYELTYFLINDDKQGENIGEIEADCSTTRWEEEFEFDSEENSAGSTVE